TPPHGMKRVSAAPGRTAASPAAAPAPAPQAQPAPAPAPTVSATGPTAPTAQAVGGGGAPAAGGSATGPRPHGGHINTPNNMFCGSCGFRLQQASAPPPRPAPEPAPAGAGITLTALRADGSEAGTFVVPGGAGTVGRETGAIFAGDSYLSPRHA